MNEIKIILAYISLLFLGCLINYLITAFVVIGLILITFTLCAFLNHKDDRIFHTFPFIPLIFPVHLYWLFFDKLEE